jgi:hypothetical protein
MKVCYCDESGTGDEPIAVMVGIIVDAQRMHVTKENWKNLLSRLSSIIGKPIEEIHTRDFYAGNGAWRTVSGEKRSEYITAIFKWLKDRHHDIVYVAVEKSKFYKSRKAGKIHKEVETLWRFMGLHLLLCVQKKHQRLAKTKGHTIFIFDNEEKERMHFTDLIANPPGWTDSYYKRGKKQARLDQIVDVPYFGDSKEVHLLQVADFLAYFLRRYIEIAEGLSQPKYDQEKNKVSDWMDVFKECGFASGISYPSRGRCDCANLFYQCAPKSIREFGRTQIAVEKA